MYEYESSGVDPGGGAIALPNDKKFRGESIMKCQRVYSICHQIKFRPSN